MTTIYMIRHGEAEGNIFRRFHGQYDALLTPRGEAQVQQLKKRFEDIHIDACFASDLTRASQTARAVYVPKGLKLQRDPRFREICVGIWEDVPYGYLDHFDEKRMWMFNHDITNWSVEGGENYETSSSRFVDGLVEAAERYDSGTIAVFSHAAVMRCALMRMLGQMDGKLGYSDNTGVSKLVYEDGKFSAVFLNDNSHLPEELSTFYIQRWWRETDNRKEAALYFQSAADVDLPQELKAPEQGMTLAAILCGRPVGTVTLGEKIGETGTIVSMKLLPGFEGRYYADQLLGCAFSHFRKLGCRTLWAAPGDYPDHVLERYEFDPESRCRSIDTTVFDWSE